MVAASERRPQPRRCLRHRPPRRRRHRDGAGRRSGPRAGPLSTGVERLAAFGRLTTRAALGGLFGFLSRDSLTYAASVAYYALLSLFPVVLLALAVLGGVTADEANREAVLGFILQYFPRQFDFITAQLDAFSANRMTFSVAGTLVLVWGALGVFGAISTAVNHAWGRASSGGTTGATRCSRSSCSRWRACSCCWPCCWCPRPRWCRPPGSRKSWAGFPPSSCCAASRYAKRRRFSSSSWSGSCTTSCRTRESAFATCGLVPS
ncbi:MAG: hypothetical protein FJW27_12375 [Acidimicrobiia bacterium]|nr:hypothetical protein [Acidimicrobiia bacterium]